MDQLALLGDPVRRALYTQVARRGDYVSRQEAARAAGVGRALAAFHLDKLADEGLLEVVYRRPPGRDGPGAGRPAKLYRRSRQQVSISLPHRDYELLATLLATSLDQELPADVQGRLTDAARRTGGALGAEARRLAGRRPSRRRLVAAGLEVLRRKGYEPHTREDQVVLRNCPFHAVAIRHRDVVCPTNLGLIEGFVTELNASGVTARYEPGEDRCCVTLRTGQLGA